jgi:DNA invertase Pin-like site-specific DNA recombinase
MTQRRTAISYSRFSDPKQARGDSEARQERDFRNFCRRHNLTPLSEVYADRGKSGYKGTHRSKGELGKLIAAAKDSKFEPGTVIVVEAWDRLGRLVPNRQIRLIEELLDTGVQIGICRLDDIFTMEDFGTHKWTTLAVFVQLAYQESKQKAERVAAAWEKRRERARQDGQSMGGRIPAWLKVVHGVMVPIPERVAAVQRIFQLSAAGYGRTRLIRTLNEEGHVPMGRSKIGWTNTYIQMILTDRRVLGEHQPTKGGRADGDKMLNYYPQIITPVEFSLARAGLPGRGGRNGPRDCKHINVFQGLLINALDGEGMYIHAKSKRSPRGDLRLALFNAAAANGRAPWQSFPYDVLETAVLGQLAEIRPEDVLPRTTEQPNKAEVLRATLKQIRGDIAGFVADLKKGHSKHLSALLVDLEKEEERIAGLLQDELAATARPAEKAWEQLPSLVDMIRVHGDEARLKIRSVLRSLTEEIRLLLVRRGSWLLAAVQCFFVGGATRHYFIAYQSAAYRRPGGYWVQSLWAFYRQAVRKVPRPIFPAEAAVKDELCALAGCDLRDREQAVAMEQELLQVDLDMLLAGNQVQPHSPSRPGKPAFSQTS